jgi:hypothetical protein
MPISLRNSNINIPASSRATARHGPITSPAACIANTRLTIMPRVYVPAYSLITVELTG